ncbi:conserved hypothetical protein [Ricinus communis]|uniref:Uncharacterized protein n=1 Tax=Ricinus communis TaxID=3988 RepID=B9RJQ9_RICCO|nr:conserved hypothetical protein [Ricinus communis]
MVAMKHCLFRSHYEVSALSMEKKKKKKNPIFILYQNQLEAIGLQASGGQIN